MSTQYPATSQTVLSHPHSKSPAQCPLIWHLRSHSCAYFTLRALCASTDEVCLVLLQTVHLLRAQVKCNPVERFEIFTLDVTALVFYDHLITLDQEIRTVWQQKFSIVSLLIVSTRWTLLLQAAVDLIPGESMVSHYYFIRRTLT